jgi:RNA recognition motif-containing protein
VRHPPGNGHAALHRFLLTHKFYAKGIHNDKVQLHSKFGVSFADNIEDIEETRLIPYGHSQNFMAMTLQFTGPPTAIFKDIRITTSDWSLPCLSARQILYAAFDVVALFQCYPQYPPAKLRSASAVKSAPPRRIKLRPPKENRQRAQPVRKEFLSRIVLKVTEAQPMVGFLVSGYRGRTDPVALRKIFVSEPPGLQFVAGWNGFVMISIAADVPFELSAPFGAVRRLPEVDPAGVSEGDVFFVKQVPTALENEDNLQQFLYSFGHDHRIAFEPWYTRIQIHHAQASMRFRTFVPFVPIEDDRPLLFDTFPTFLPMVRATLPPHFDEAKVRAFFGEVTNVSFLRRRAKREPMTAIVTFDSIDASLRALELCYATVGGFTIYVHRFTDENHLRFLRCYALVIREDCSDERALRDRFSRYREVFLATYDRFLGVGCVQFFNKLAASRASVEANTIPMPLGTVGFIRNLPLDTTEQRVLELTRKFGRVLSLTFRDLDDFMRTCIAEVVFETETQAAALKKALHQCEYEGNRLEINAIIPRTTEAPVWKMQQRKLWVSMTEPEGIEKAFERASEFGRILEVREHPDGFYVKFLRGDAAGAGVAQHGFRAPAPLEFATKIIPEDFEILRVLFQPRECIGQQIMAVVIDPLPASLPNSRIEQLLVECRDYAIMIKKSVEASESDKRALIYTKSKSAMVKVHGKLHNLKVDGELLALFKYPLRKIPRGPRHHPFEEIHKPRKMAIVVDPIPDTLTEKRVREMMADCGKYDLKISKSALSEAKRRLLIQPRNLKAKSECFRILSLTAIDGHQLSVVRMKREDISKSLAEEEEEGNEEDQE